MKLISIVRLDPSPLERSRLLTRMREFNHAANWLSEIAFKEKLWTWLALQRRAYRELRIRFGLCSCETVVCVRKVAGTYKNKAHRSRQAVFRPLGSVPLYKHRYKRDGSVAFYGFRIPLRSNKGVELTSRFQGKLLWDGAKFLIHQVLEVQEQPAPRPVGYLGVDLGLARIAVDSDGTTHPEKRHPFAPGQLRGLRKRHARFRRKLQKKRTKSAKRLLRKRRRREKRFARHVNHAVAKDLVAKAKGSGRGIALEDLQGIRASIKAKRSQRRDHSSWAFGELRLFIEYKARKEGVKVELVDPSYTSLTCPKCGVVDKRNRPKRDEFQCVGCGFAGPADAIAAENIRRAAGNRPDAAA